ncbi:MAG: SCO family protein [Sulfuricella sp.]
MIIKRMLLALYLLALALSAHAADAPADAGMAEVRGLGRLNGVALACSYHEVAAHIKLIVIQRAPIARRYGDAFELTTREAYLDKIKKDQEACPDIAVITSQVEELATHLQAAVVPEAPKQQDQQDNDGQSDVGIIPRYLLMDTKGQAVTQQNFPGKFQLIAFGYTFCPDICPTTLAEMTIIMGKLGNLADRLQPIFVSVDPERDTPEKLRQYTAFFDPRIVALTGSPELVRHAANNFKVRYEKHLEPGTAPDKYSVDHSAGMYLLGPDGRYLGKFAYRTPPTEAAERIKVLMGKEP